ncbi:uncharacterized protein LOC144626794 [Crassostrea virginica]
MLARNEKTMSSCHCIDSVLSSGSHKVAVCTEKRLESLDHVMRCIRAGELGCASHIRVHRARTLHVLWWTFDYSYDHHFLVTEATEEGLVIIHYAPKTITGMVLLRGVAEIIQESLVFATDREILDFDSGVFLVDAEVYPKTAREKSECVKRARRRLGERQYSVFHNNCDCLVSWTLCGCSYSRQAMNAKGLLLWIGICARYCIKTYRAIENMKNFFVKLYNVTGE